MDKREAKIARGKTTSFDEMPLRVDASGALSDHTTCHHNRAVSTVGTRYWMSAEQAGHSKSQQSETNFQRNLPLKATVSLAGLVCAAASLVIET